MRARDRQAQNLAELRCRREQERTQNQDQVIAEFGGDLRAIADEILRLRRGLAQIADAIDWMKAGAPFGVVPPGPFGKQQPEKAPRID
jgi:hypothetical protein